MTRFSGRWRVIGVAGGKARADMASGVKTFFMLTLKSGRPC